MTATIRKDHVFTDTFLCLLGKIGSISKPSGTGKWVYEAFPEDSIDKQDAYPLIVIESPSISYDQVCFKDVKKGPVRIVLDVYATSAKDLDSISDSVIAKMESEESNFHISGISIMSCIGTVSSQFQRSDFRVHNKMITYDFEYWWF